MNARSAGAEVTVLYQPWASLLLKVSYSFVTFAMAAGLLRGAADAAGFLRLGGHVRFVPERTRTGLLVSVANLRASGLDAESQHLRIASAQ